MFCFHCAFGLHVPFPNLWGASPLSCNLLHNIWFRSSATQLPFKAAPPPPTSPHLDFALFESLPRGLQGWLELVSNIETRSGIECNKGAAM